jgi:hypothetical protein
MNVQEAVESYLKVKKLAGRGLVLAALARTLAAQLDATAEAGTARGMTAAPPIASRLLEVVAEIEKLAPENADELAKMLRPLRRAA